MSISSAIPIHSIANYLKSGGNASPRAASSGPAASSPGSSGATAPNGSTALYQQLSNDVQSYLVRLQGGGGLAPSAPTANGAATQASAGATGSNAASGTDASSSGSQAVGRAHHHHHAGGGQAGDGNLNTDSVNPLNDLAGGPASGTGTSSTSASSGLFGGTSTRYTAALQAYANTAGQSALSSLA